MNGILLQISEENRKLPVGASKLFGNPDVWDGFAWPNYAENGEEYDLTFLGQIDCTAASRFDTDGVLPKTGMLYFFYDMDNMPPDSCDRCTARVLYYDAEPSRLHAMLRTDHEGNDMSLREMKLNFLSRDTPCDEFQAQLGGPVSRGWQPLLKIRSFETNTVSIRFADKGALRFSLDPKKLEQRDFNDVCVRQTID